MHFQRRVRRVVFGTARGSPANNPGGSPRCRRGPSTDMPSAQHVNVKFFEFTRARTRPATGRSPRAPAQSRRKRVWGTRERPARRTEVKAPRPGRDMCWLSARRLLATLMGCSRGPCCPRVTSSFLQGPRSETALCAARTPPRQPGAQVPGPRNAFLQRRCIRAKWRRGSTRLACNRRSKGEICAVSASANSNDRDPFRALGEPQSLRAAPQDTPHGTRGVAACANEISRSRLRTARTPPESSRGRPPWQPRRRRVPGVNT